MSIKGLDLRNTSEVSAYIHRLEFNYKSVTDTLHQSQEHWEKEKENLEADIKRFRELCKKILAKDRSEAKLGREYSWDNLSSRELYEKADAFFDQYNIDRQNLMFSIQEKYEQLLEAYEQLNEQKDALQEEILDTSSHGIDLIIEESEDFKDDEGRIVNIAETIKMLEEYKPTSSTIPAYESSQKEKLLKEREANARLQAAQDASKLENKLSPDYWKVIELLGKQGISRLNLIQKELEERHGMDKNSSRKLLDDLQDHGVVMKSEFNTPLVSRLALIRLTQNCGKILYEHRYGVLAKESEWERVEREHDNVLHGYGILEVASLLRMTKLFFSVDEFCRNKGIHLEGGKMFIPDIIVEQNQRKLFVEYETGDSNPADIDKKLTKMSQCTPFIFIVVKNNPSIEQKYNPRIERWVKVNKDTEWARLNAKGIYLTTPKYIQDAINGKKGELKNITSLFPYYYDFKGLRRMVKR